MSCELIWITPNPEQAISDIARVSNPANQGLPPGKLLKYCVEHQHWSPFEMANACIEINTTRDIARQILRHRSFSFQEFSQRYASTELLGIADFREARFQDKKNRQNSVELDEQHTYLKNWWMYKQAQVIDTAEMVYKEALEAGIAKEVARAVLPEGLTSTRMYMNGTIRSWMHYTKLRMGNGTQKEHMLIAQEINQILKEQMPNIWEHLQ
jgi:thymidylate synthase (FAD)